MIIETPIRALDTATCAPMRRAILIAVDNVNWVTVFSDTYAATRSITQDATLNAIRNAVSADPKPR